VIVEQPETDEAVAEQLDVGLVQPPDGGSAGGDLDVALGVDITSTGPSSRSIVCNRRP